MFVEMKSSWMNQSSPQDFSRLGKDFLFELHHHNVNSLQKNISFDYQFFHHIAYDLIDLALF